MPPMKPAHSSWQMPPVKPATSAHSKPRLAYPLGIWGLGNYWTYSEGVEAIQPLLVHLRLKSCSLKLEEQNEGMLTCHLDFLV